MPAFHSNGSILRKFLQLKGLNILDVGSGTGKLTRYMTRHGARVIGLECGAAQLEKARSIPAEGNESYVEGFGQDMPFEDGSFDGVVFFNSLHHIPVEHMACALAQAARVIHDQGTIYIAEPLASGTGFKLHAPIDDETQVRALAYQALQEAAHSMANITETSEITYSTACFYKDYEDFRDESIRIEPTRQTIFNDHNDTFRDNFNVLGVLEEKGYRFDQPMRVNVLNKK